MALGHANTLEKLNTYWRCERNNPSEERVTEMPRKQWSAPR
jgi:hypothetical protein